VEGVVDVEHLSDGFVALRQVRVAAEALTVAVDELCRNDGDLNKVSKSGLPCMLSEFSG
jgi:hypothetical protein